MGRNIKKYALLLLLLLLCSVCFGVKCFLKNYFGIFRRLVGAKIIVSENYFQFDRKSLFNFWKMIYGFEYRKSFSEFKHFILASRFVRIIHYRALEFVGSPNLPLKIPVYQVSTLATATRIR
jgi:hypothetical protein